MKKGDLVKVLIEYPPGLEDIIRENEREAFNCLNRMGVVVERHDAAEAVRVRMDGERFESTGYWFTHDDVELVASDPLEE